MNVKEENICRLCLQVAENDYELIDETIRNMVKDLSLTMNLDISKDPIVCKDCRETSIKCFDFKSVCTVTEERILSFAANKNPTTLTLKDIFNDGQDTETVDDNFICRFCLNHLNGCNFVSSDSLMNDVMFVEKLQALLPVMDFDIIKNPVNCMPCGQDAMCYVKFAENCVDVEDKITNYCHSQDDDTPSSAQIKLSDVLRFLFNNILESDNSGIHGIKKEEDTFEYLAETHSQVYDSVIIKAEEEIDVKEHGFNCDETGCEALSAMPVRNLGMSCESTNATNAPTTSLCATIHNPGIKCDKVTNIPSVSTNNVSEATILKCASCTYETKCKNHLKTHKDNIKVEMFNCPMCTYVTKRKGSLKTHTLIHKNVTDVKMYKCPTCTYETKYKSCLKTHILIHKNITDVETFTCPTCTYETKRKSHLKTHMLIHKDVTEVEMFTCSICSYETKRKTHLKTHMLSHKDVAKAEMFKCSTCTYETKRKNYLTSHLLIHKDVTQVEMYKCSMCTYETKYKSSLKTHTLIHKDVTEVEMFNCPLCTYGTKRKSYLKTHMLIHKNNTEVETFNCSLCTYETKHKRKLKAHMLSHKDNTEVEMYKCSACDFQTKRKAHLKRHTLTHKQMGSK